MSTVDSASLLIDGPWEHRYVAANGARFHVAVAGPDDRDAPLVVLLHGIPAVLVGVAAPAPRARRRRVPRGRHGRARHRAAPTSRRRATTSRRWRPTSPGVIQSLGAADAVDRRARGTGGEIAWAMAGLHPDRVRAVAALAAPHPLDTRGHPRAAVRPSALRRLAFVQLPVAARSAR